MKKLTLSIVSLMFAFTASVASADPANPSEVILGNDGKFNAAPGICLQLRDAGVVDKIGECVKFIQEFVVSPPACDGHLHTDTLQCGNGNSE